MPQKLSRDELIALIKTIQTVRDQETGRRLTEKEHCALVVKFKKSILHPGGSDLIYYPKLAGLPREPTAEEIADLALRGGSPEHQ